MLQAGLIGALTFVNVVMVGACGRFWWALSSRGERSMGMLGRGDGHLLGLIPSIGMIIAVLSLPYYPPFWAMMTHKWPKTRHYRQLVHAILLLLIPISIMILYGLAPLIFESYLEPPWVNNEINNSGMVIYCFAILYVPFTIVMSYSPGVRSYPHMTPRAPSTPSGGSAPVM